MGRTNRRLFDQSPKISLKRQSIRSRGILEEESHQDDETYINFPNEHIARSEEATTTVKDSNEDSTRNQGANFSSIALPNEFSGSDLSQRISTICDKKLILLTTACKARASEVDLTRYLSAHDDPQFRKDVIQIWKGEQVHYNIHYFCNFCGSQHLQSKQCCGENGVLKYIRVGGFSQLMDIARLYFEEIIEIRKKLNLGTDKNHNLNGDLLKKLWKKEGAKNLDLTVIGSIDGVSVNGNTNNKLWPITLMIVDLPTFEMQKNTNIVLQGIVEGPMNPSTIFWNSVMSKVYADIEEPSAVLSNMTIKFKIVSWTADQPAKRSLFGMKACNAESSCFFGMCTGTYHKTMGPFRYNVRGDILTRQDAETGINGFRGVKSNIIDHVLPYETIVDLLHNGSEGIFQTIYTETLQSDHTKNRSDLFHNDADNHKKIIGKVCLPPEHRTKELTNGSQKLTFFRLEFGLAALVNSSLKPEARLAILSLMLCANQMYTNAGKSGLFFVHLTGAARWALTSASRENMSTKAHELLCHLPYTIQQFGNIAPLSTFTFEHFYKYALKGYNTQSTKGFTERAISRYAVSFDPYEYSRVLLNTAVRREVKFRAKKGGSFKLNTFLTVTPSLRPFQPSWKYRIRELIPEDRIEDFTGCQFFAVLHHSMGKLESNYKQKNSARQIFFAENNKKIHACYRFIAVCKLHNVIQVLAERIRPISSNDEFPLVKNSLDTLKMPASTYGYNVLNQLKRYQGLIDGQLSGERELLEITKLKGVGGYLKHGSSTYYIQINGAFVHH